MGDNKSCKCGSCSCMHHNMGSIFMILIGLNFLMVAMGVYDEMLSAYVWPTLLILAGLMKMMGANCGCCSAK
jgi:hypothetical protein